MTRPNEAAVAIRFGNNLHAVMKHLGMNQKTLANRAGLTQTCISQILNAEREPRLSTILKIMKVIPVTFEVLNK